MPASRFGAKWKSVLLSGKPVFRQFDVTQHAGDGAQWKSSRRGAEGCTQHLRKGNIFIELLLLRLSLDTYQK